MRLLYLSADPGIPILGHKGGSVHVRELCSAFVQAGVELHLASPRTAPEGDRLAVTAQLHKISPIPPKEQSAASLPDAVSAQADEVATLCEQLHIDAIYERFSLFTAAGVRAATKLGLPHALEVNAPLRQEAARFRTLPLPDHAEALELETLGSTDRIFAVSPALGSWLTQNGAEASKVEVAPNGVAAERFPTPRRDPDRFVVGFAGSMKAWHGLETLIAAVQQAPDVHLEVAGHGPLEHLLDQLPSDRLTRHGAVTHDIAIALMTGWDVGVAPYAAIDGFWFSPLKVLEYMAAGACPVVSDLGDAAELLGRGERGMVIPPDDPGQLALALQTLSADRARAAQLGDRAREWVTAHRSWRTNADRALTALYATAQECAA